MVQGGILSGKGCGGLNVGDDCGRRRGDVAWRRLFPERLQEEAGKANIAGFGIDVVGDGRERAESGMLDNLFDEFSGWLGVAGGLNGAREIHGGDLEAVEEESGSARVEVVGRNAAEDLADGELDCGSVFGQRDLKGGLAGAAFPRVGDGETGGVMVITKFFVALRVA